MNAPADKDVCPPSFVAVRAPTHDVFLFLCFIRSPLPLLGLATDAFEIIAETWGLESRV